MTKKIYGYEAAVNENGYVTSLRSESGTYYNLYSYNRRTRQYDEYTGTVSQVRSMMKREALHLA